MLLCEILSAPGDLFPPTILFMLQTGRGVAGAIGFLASYNLAFVGPLVVVFLLAYCGTRSDKLTRAFEEHAAGVKFATAMLFLALFLFFVFADRIPAFTLGS